MAFKIVEKYPDGKGSFRYITRWIDSIARTSDDMLDVWNALEPDIKKTMKYAFSEANPSGWTALESKYKQWKAKNNYFTTIGVMTGALRQAVSDKAVVKKGKKSMTYTYNPDVIQRLTHTSRSSQKKVGDYIGYFNDKRPVFEWARGYLEKHVKNIYMEYVRKNTKTVKVNEK